MNEDTLEPWLEIDYGYKSHISLIDSEVKARQLTETFEYLGYNFYPDPVTIPGMFMIVGSLPEGYEEEWKTADKEVDGYNNVYVTLSKDDIKGLFFAYQSHVKAIWKEGDERKKIIKAEYLNRLSEIKE